MKMNKTMLRFVCCLLCLCMCLTACNKKEAAKPTQTEPAPKDVIYTIHVKTAGGMTLNNVVAYVYEDATDDDLLTYGTLDNNGSFTFTALESDKYTVRFANLPEEGYDVQESYPITGTTTNITLTASPVMGKDPLEEGKRYELGDVMRDFTVTTVEGTELTLSEILKDKQAVVLNFWYTGCNPCKKEFPLLQKAYEAYSDKLEVITMNPIDITRDTAEKIIQFRDENGLTMPMAICSSQWLSALGIAGYPTTVIIDRYGVVCLFASAVEDEGVFEAAFEHFTAENYEQKLIADINELYSVDYELGHEKNPLQAHGGMESFEVTVPAGGAYHVSLFRGNGLVLRMESPNAYLIVDDVRYEPNSKGVIEMEIVNPDVNISTNLIIGNTSNAPLTVTVTLRQPQGTFTNPLDATLGTNTVTVEEGNEQGVYYTWTAQEAGIFTVAVAVDPKNTFDIQLYNLNTYAMRGLIEADQVTEDGKYYVSVEVNAGDVVSIGYMSVPDASFNYPEVTIEAELSFELHKDEDLIYSITCRDNSGNPMENVCVSIQIDGVESKFYSDASGLVEMALPADTYTVRITVPEGYECDTTQFLLTATKTSAEVVFVLYVPEQLTYTVQIVDEAGAPVANATVVLDGSLYYSDENGMVTVTLAESDSYIISVVAPEGYTLEESTYAFGESTTLTIVVTRVGEVITTIDYTVKVVEADGKAFTNVTVHILAADGTVVASQAVDSNGKLVVALPEAHYTVKLIFSDNYGYETTNIKLSAGEPSTTIKVAPYWDGTTEELYTEDVALNLEVGSFYVDLEGKDIQYFVFTPTQTGTFTFTTTNPKAVVGYWGSPNFIFGASIDENIKDNVFTMEVKSVGQTIVLSVSGGEGISGTIVTVKRTGGTNDIPRENFQGTSTPTTPFVVEETGTKTYLDLSISHTLVKGSDGYYHWNSEDGDIVYMDLTAARFGVSISALVDVTSMHKYEFDSNGNPTKRIDYTECMISYVLNVDSKYGVYALTDDLITILQGHGGYAGWYDSSSYGYLFDGENVLPESAWMFLLCTIN